MKVFLDRFTDLLTVAKGKGHMLRRMRMLLIAVSNSPKLPQRFNIPFSATADYLGIQYRGTFFCPSSAMGRPIANQQLFTTALG